MLFSSGVFLLVFSNADGLSGITVRLRPVLFSSTPTPYPGTRVLSIALQGPFSWRLLIQHPRTHTALPGLAESSTHGHGVEESIARNVQSASLAGAVPPTLHTSRHADARNHHDRS